MATIKKISNCGQTIPLVCAVLRYVLENLHMPHVLHTTALAKVTLNRMKSSSMLSMPVRFRNVSRCLSFPGKYAPLALFAPEPVKTRLTIAPTE